MDITEFLEARITEDEARANACTAEGYDLNWRMEGTSVYPLYQMTDGSPNDGNWITEEHAAFITTNDPIRVLAECAAKREIIEGIIPERDPHSGKPDYDPLWIIRALAAVYTDHPDYQQEWANAG